MIRPYIRQLASKVLSRVGVRLLLASVQLDDSQPEPETDRHRWMRARIQWLVQFDRAAAGLRYEHGRVRDPRMVEVVHGDVRQAWSIERVAPSAAADMLRKRTRGPWAH